MRVPTSAAGLSDGSTIVAAALNDRAQNADEGKWVVVNFGYTATITGFTAASPSVITTAAAHGLWPGAIITISGSTDGRLDGTWTVATVFGPTQFAGIGLNSAGTGTAGSISASSSENALTVFGQVSASAGPPGSGNPASYTLNITPPLGQTVPANATFELMAYRPDWYTQASNNAIQNIYPWLYQPLLDMSIVIPSPAVYRYTLPNGTYSVALTQAAAASPALAPSVVSTATPHNFFVGMSIVIAGCSASAVNGSWQVTTIPSITSFTAVSGSGTALTSVAGGSGGTITTAQGNVVLPDDLTRVMMTDPPGFPHFGEPYHDLPDWTTRSIGPGGAQQLALNTLGAPFSRSLWPNANIALIGWQHLSTLQPDAAMFQLTGDMDPVNGPELAPGSQYDLLLREWILAYLLRIEMAAPSTLEREKMAAAFQAQYDFAQLQATNHQMPRPDRRRSQ